MSGRVERAAYLVFGAREVDESDEGSPTFSQFDKDWDAQLQQCGRLAAERGYQPVGSSVFSVLQASMDRLLEWADDPGCDVVLVASPRLLRRMHACWPDWDQVVARLGAAGARLEAVPFPEPAYPGERFPE
ncbi:hypothetical protein [Streptomyces buecherae]|uniref:Recombinase family protein n=1 Tax=Streptomyces buecherae TaxID=2763006 RepID=A0A7H8N780_9ACTN|nr:hypothetical protein [Streptomyces buecherae]QKW50156.1 hypothetical protein HUT08_12105 [Streptomyces buecherae]